MKRLMVTVVIVNVLALLSSFVLNTTTPVRAQARQNQLVETTVYANESWQDTGTTVLSGQPVTAKADGLWSAGVGPGGDSYGPEGGNTICPQNACLASGERKGALLLKVAGEIQVFTANTNTFTFQNGGEVYAAINDDQWGLSDNWGSMDLTFY
jgi:hypothetical protein